MIECTNDYMGCEGNCRYEACDLFKRKDSIKMVKEPILKKGEIAKCYNGVEYEIIEVSNEYNEVAGYDSNGICAADLEEYKAFDDALFIAVRRLSDRNYFVFCCSRDSEILGD